MQNTPFSHIQHHQDGKHVFTVVLDGEKKAFVTTSMIPPAKALRHALNWRNSKTGETILPSDEVRIERFAKELENPAPTTKPVKTVPVKAVIPQHVKVQQLPSGVRRTDENTIRKTIKTGQPKISETERMDRHRQLCKEVIGQTNSTRPSLLSGISVMKIASGAVVFNVIAYTSSGKRKDRQFIVGGSDNFSLAKYRMMRHIATCFRKEYLESVIEKREMDLDAFDNPRKKVMEGTFRWPFTGTLPPRSASAERKRGRMTREEFRLSRLVMSMDVKKGLPKGVRVYRSTSGRRKRAEYQMQVNYTLNGKQMMKGFYLGLEGNVTLSRYRLIRHLALAFRREYITAEVQKREPNFDLFNDWRNNLESLLEVYPYKWSVPEFERKSISIDPTVKLNNRAGLLAKDVLQYLASRKEFAAVMATMDADSADVVTLGVAEIINAEMYKSSRKS